MDIPKGERSAGARVNRHGRIIPKSNPGAVAPPTNQTNMTLTEYINQTNPQPGVKVVLKEGEYIRRNTVKATPFSFHTAINIPAIAQRYGIEGSYIWLGNNPQLFTRNPQTGGGITRKRVFPARQYPRTSRNHPLPPIPKGEQRVYRTMGNRQPL